MANKLTSAQKDELINTLKQEIALANFQELLKSITEKCFKKCINKPGISLDSGETKCINLCVDRFMDSRNLVTRSYATTIQKKIDLQ